jgi:hypothetical protein
MKYFSKKQTGIFWLFVIASGLLESLDATACAEVYFKVGAGYQFLRTESLIMQDGSKQQLAHTSPISARIELGVQKGNLSYGIAHHSNWFAGWPVNNDPEFDKSEVFIDYKFTLWGM